MNVEGAEFSLGKTYEVDDIVYISEISSSSAEQTIIADGTYNLTVDTNFFKKSDLIVSVYLKRNAAGVAGFESYTKFVTNANEFDSTNSEGVGIGLRFKNSVGNTVDTLGRLVPYGNIPVSNYKCIKFIVKKSEIPSSARTVCPVALASSVSVGSSFTFKDVDLRYLNKYFYCIQENTSDASNQPSSDDGTDYWTKDFLWRPSYGAKFSFSNLVKRKMLGDGYKQTFINGLNSMKLEIDYSFPNLTTKRASAIINFLQQSTEIARSSFHADDRANPLVSSLIDYINLELPFPYKSKNVVVSNFSHEENYLNNHTVQVTFLCDKESNLQNIESYAGNNSKLDQSSVITLDTTKNLIKGEQFQFNLNSRIQGNGSRKSGVLLKNYIKGTLLVDDGDGGVNVIQFTPTIDYSIQPDNSGMEIVFPFLQNPLRNSIFIDDVSDLEYYPYNKIRTLPSSPDLDFSISKQPLENQTSLGDGYNLYIKKDLNSNLIEIDLTFSRRSDQEIKLLLFFLESHLGYLPFRFKVPEVYNNKEENQNFKKQINRVFYCPNWSHSYNYKNNHSLRANFIEYSLPTE